MKTIPSVLLLAGLLVLTGCHSITMTSANGTVWKVRSFGQRTVISGASVSTNGTFTINGYNNDQVTLPLAVFQGLVAAAAKAPIVP